jgi:hypothetical protein
MYKEDFDNAYYRSCSFNLQAPTINYTDKLFLTEELKCDLQELIAEEFGRVNPQELSANCLAFHLKLKPFFEKILSSEIYFTIGYVTCKGQEFFHLDDSDITELLKNGINDKVDFHAWLTLPSMEIIDLTFLTTFAIRYNIEECMGGLILSQADKLKGEMKFIPILIGDEFLSKIGAYKTL